MTWKTVYPTRYGDITLAPEPCASCASCRAIGGVFYALRMPNGDLIGGSHWREHASDYAGRVFEDWR